MTALNVLRTPFSHTLAAQLRAAQRGGARCATALSATALSATALSAGWRTRFAPAPTGLLHLGHVVNALYVWGIARAFGGQVLLRIEDHDRARCRPEFELALLDDLDWLGLQPDIGRTSEFRAGPHPLRQSDNASRYESALSALQQRDLLYVCNCTRKDIAALAPHSSGEEVRYPGTCASLALKSLQHSATRVRVAATDVRFEDLRLGLQVQRPVEQCGDFLVRDRHDNYTYQLAVTVDDWQQDISVVIRGEDLLSSTGRQLQLAEMLGRTNPLLFLHHGLILRPDGLKLSKSLGDTGVQEMRNGGATPQQVLGRAALASGLIETPAPIHAEEISGLFA